MENKSTIYFYGGAGTVTGSNFLLDGGSSKILIDCGLFQGEHSFDDTNWLPFPFNPSEISYLINTHAHIDHIGRIPKLVKDGYRGRILSTEATRALAEPMLLDAMELSRKTALKIGKEPLYDEKDIHQALAQWDTVPYHKAVELPDGFSVEFFDSGHILGSAIAKFTRAGKSVAFTGDLGGGNSPLLSLCEIPGGVDYLVMESVYGDRIQKDRTNRLDDLKKSIEDIAGRGGTLLIPAFSTERTQDLLYEIRALMTEKKVPSMPVYLDSPLAEKITASYLAYPQYFSKAMQQRVQGGEHIFEFAELHYVHDAGESRAIAARPGPKIILAGSGMSNGGRVVGHEADILPDAHSTLLIVGYQAAGSLGRKLAEGATSVVIKGQKIAVRAHVDTMYGYSAHMDSEQLLAFAQQVGEANTGGGLQEVFVVMGEPAAASFLVQRIRDYAGLHATAPTAGEKAEVAV